MTPLTEMAPVGDKEVTDHGREDERTWRSGCGGEQAPGGGGAACRELTGFESYSLYRLCFRILPSKGMVHLFASQSQ